MATAGRTSPGKKRGSPRSKGLAAKPQAKAVRGKAGLQVDPETKAQAGRVLRRLKADYPGATCALENETPFELLVATILSAQCTDARVNMVTPELFRRWPTAREMADAPIGQLEKVI